MLTCMSQPPHLASLAAPVAPSALADFNHVASRKGTPAGVAVAATIGNLVSITPALSATFGTFLVPISTDFGWSRALVSGVLGLVSLVSAIAYPLVGRLIDQYGARRILITGNILFALSLAAISLAPANVGLFYLLFGAVGVAGSIPSTAMFCKVVSGWFDEKRGLMLGLTAGLGNGVGATIMPVTAGLLLGPYGWRGAFIGVALIVLVLGAPVLLLLLRDAPGSTLVQRRDETPLDGVTVGEAIRTPIFWLLLLGAAAGAGGMTAVFTHVVPILADRGIGLGEATLVVAIFALVTAAWQVTSGYLLDRLRTPRLITPMYAIAIGGLLLLHLGQGHGALMLAGALLGIGLGAEYAALPYFISRYFGLRHYGTITGVLYSVVILVQGVAPTLMDVSFDHRRHYDFAIWVTIGALVVGMTLFACLPRPADPAPKEPS